MKITCISWDVHNLKPRPYQSMHMPEFSCAYSNVDATLDVSRDLNMRKKPDIEFLCSISVQFPEQWPSEFRWSVKFNRKEGYELI